MTVWVVRGGEDLKYLPWFESEDVVGIGWSELPRSPIGMSRQELAGVLRATYPDASPNTIANNTGQIWNFVNTIALGDLVVVPLKASRSFRVGRVVGPAEHREHLAETGRGAAGGMGGHGGGCPGPGRRSAQCPGVDHDGLQAASAGGRTAAGEHSEGRPRPGA